jgi:hypothetical protein
VPRTFEDKLEGRPEALRKAEMAIADMHISEGAISVVAVQRVFAVIGDE